MNHGTGGGHGKAAGHVVLVLQYAFFEELVSSRRSLAGVNDDFPVFTSYLLPVGDFTTEDVFQLLTCKLFYRIGGMHHHGQGVIGDNRLFYICLGGFGFHLFTKLDGTGSHGNVCCVVHQCGDTHTGSASGDGDAGIGMFVHETLCSLLGNRKDGITTLDALGMETGNGKGKK